MDSALSHTVSLGVMRSGGEALQSPLVTISLEEGPDVGRAIFGEDEVRSAVPLHNVGKEEEGQG